MFIKRTKKELVIKLKQLRIAKPEVVAKRIKRVANAQCLTLLMLVVGADNAYDLLGWLYVAEKGETYTI